jgi:hypothetical protein
MTNPEEIWAARLQRELVALSSGSASSKEEKDPKGDDVSTNHAAATHNPIGALPPFVQMKDYKLEIEHGFCQVSFVITIDGVKAPAVLVSSSQENEDNGNAKYRKDSNLDQVHHGNDMATTTTAAATTTATTTAATTTATTTTTAVSTLKEEKENVEKAENAENANTNTNANANIDKNEEEDAFQVQVVITLDASLKRSLVDFHPSTSYPFQPPICIINSGAEYLPKDQHSIRNGEEVQLDCDWTPSLHLNDAALNVAVKVRESIKRGEPILEYTHKSANNNNLTSSLPNSLLDEVSQDFNKASHAISGFFADLKTRASHVADELDQAVIGSTNTTEMTSVDERSKKGFKFRKGIKKKKEDEELLKIIITEENVQMGDSIDLAEAPWNQALGMYPCKAIRRPHFMSTAMALVGDNEEEKTKVTAAGLSGAGSIFKSFTNSAKSLVEESFLMLTNNLIMEITCNKFSVASATVKFAIPVSHLSKLKFKREESVSLFFKQAPDDPIIYMCADSADAVKQIQSILKAHGVKGKHTNAAMQNVILEAVEMLEDIQVRQQLLEKDPSKQMVTDIMDLYRQAAEKFELADDARHEQVVKLMKEFLAKPTVASILDDSFVPASAPKAEETNLSSKTKEASDIASEGESSAKEVKTVDASSETNIIETETPSPPNADEEETMDERQLKAEEEELRKAMQEAESMIQSAHEDLTDLTIDDIDDEDINFNNDVTSGPVEGKKDSGDVELSEFEDMLADADKELSELIGSSL